MQPPGCVLEKALLISFEDQKVQRTNPLACHGSTQNKHFLSDVVFGAALGVAAGRTVTFDRCATRLEIAPIATLGGAGIGVTIFGR